MNDDHEHDEEGNCIIVAQQDVPVWRFSMWDVAGIAAMFAGGILSVGSQAMQLLARECTAAANKSRSDKDARIAERKHAASRRAMARDLRELVDKDSS